LKPQEKFLLQIKSLDGKVKEISVLSRLDSPLEVEYYCHGGILPFVLRSNLTVGM
jgi:aconitate hydratase